MLYAWTACEYLDQLVYVQLFGWGQFVIMDLMCISTKYFGLRSHQGK